MKVLNFPIRYIIATGTGPCKKLPRPGGVDRSTIGEQAADNRAVVFVIFVIAGLSFAILDGSFDAKGRLVAHWLVHDMHQRRPMQEVGLTVDPARFVSNLAWLSYCKTLALLGCTS